VGVAVADSSCADRPQSGTSVLFLVSPAGPENPRCAFAGLTLLHRRAPQPRGGRRCSMTMDHRLLGWRDLIRLRASIELLGIERSLGAAAAMRCSGPANHGPMLRKCTAAVLCYTRAARFGAMRLCAAVYAWYSLEVCEMHVNSPARK